MSVVDPTSRVLRSRFCPEAIEPGVPAARAVKPARRTPRFEQREYIVLFNETLLYRRPATASRAHTSNPSRFPVHAHRTPHTHSPRSSRLCSPNPSDGLRDAHVVGLKLVQADADGDGRGVEQPPEALAEAGVSLLGDIVDENLLEAEVRVQQHGAAEDGVHGGVEGAGGEGSDGQGTRPAARRRSNVQW
ncbi:hypothetical protein ACCO45_006807 [Purpureocillium lilacinum]|uniref:Uncharacterized protein n=1 Tax=Purpureocillium lilacinum TaxID=33203 RepID=A0ACC4DQI8_PURLI